MAEEKKIINYYLDGTADITGLNITQKEYLADKTLISESNYWLSVSAGTPTTGILMASQNDNQQARYAELTANVTYNKTNVGSVTSEICVLNPIKIEQEKHPNLYGVHSVWVTNASGGTESITKPNLTGGTGKKLTFAPNEFDEFGGICYINAYTLENANPKKHITNRELYSIEIISNPNNMDFSIDPIPKANTEKIKWTCRIGANETLEDKAVTLKLNFIYDDFSGWDAPEYITITQEKHWQVIGDTVFEVSPTLLEYSGGTVTVTAWYTVDGVQTRLNNINLSYSSESVAKSGVTLKTTNPFSYEYTVSKTIIGVHNATDIAKEFKFYANKGNGVQYSDKPAERLETSYVQQKGAPMTNVFSISPLTLTHSGGTAVITAYTEIDNVKYVMNKPSIDWDGDITTYPERNGVSIANAVGNTYNVTFGAITNTTLYGVTTKKVRFKTTEGKGITMACSGCTLYTNYVEQSSPKTKLNYKLEFNENGSNELELGYSASGNTVAVDVVSYMTINETTTEFLSMSATSTSSWVTFDYGSTFSTKKTLSGGAGAEVKFNISARSDDESEKEEGTRTAEIIIHQIIKDGYYIEGEPLTISLFVTQDDKNRVAIPNFDYILITYDLNDCGGGKDLDTITTAEYTPLTWKGSSYPYRVVGYGVTNCQFIQRVGGSGGYGDSGSTLYCTGDNQSGSDVESVLFAPKLFFDEDFVASEKSTGKREFSLCMCAGWYNTVGTQIKLNIIAYQGNKPVLQDGSSYKLIPPIDANILYNQTVGPIIVNKSCSGSASNWDTNNMGGYQKVAKFSFKYNKRENPSNSWDLQTGNTWYFYDGTDTPPANANARMAIMSFDEELNPNELLSDENVIINNVYNYVYSESNLITTNLENELYNGLFDNGSEFIIKSGTTFDRELTFNDPNPLNDDSTQYLMFSEVPVIRTKYYTYTAKTATMCNSMPATIPSTWTDIMTLKYKYKSVTPNIAIAWEITDNDY